jgi:hypothetical protein
MFTAVSLAAAQNTQELLVDDPPVDVCFTLSRKVLARNFRAKAVAVIGLSRAMKSTMSRTIVNNLEFIKDYPPLRRARSLYHQLPARFRFTPPSLKNREHNCHNDMKTRQYQAIQPIV